MVRDPAVAVGPRGEEKERKELAMGRRHQKGDVAVPSFHASGTGRDLYLDPNTAAAGPPAPAQPLSYTDIETGERCTLRW